MQAGDLARLASCSRVCRHLFLQPALWQGLTITRFGEDPVQQGSSFDAAALRAIYRHKSRLAVPAVDIAVEHAAAIQVCAKQHVSQISMTLQAIHLGGQYLVHEVMADSTYGQILRLKSVCWLDIQAEFHVSYMLIQR